MELYTGDRVMFRSYLKHANRLMVDEPHRLHDDGTEKRWCFIAIDDLVAQLHANTEIGLLSERKS